VIGLGLCGSTTIDMPGSRASASAPSDGQFNREVAKSLAAMTGTGEAPRYAIGISAAGLGNKGLGTETARLVLAYAFSL